MSKDINSGKNLTSIELGPQAKGFVSFLAKDPSLNRAIKDFRYGYIRASSFFKKKIPKVKLTLVYSREEMNNLTGHKTASWFVGILERFFVTKSAIYLFGKFITLMNPYGLKKDSLIVWRVKKVG
ncbi:MAG: hypothetical protein UU41_C0047G0009 [Candidatus Roizmanbacteria bacterium GW2011_GWA1_41_13]|uniref:Uncharacterized protein n=1 Tax=Candidatus Roizmanbacteria bacterium GW2011_GWA1_41_13 TaxID=1618474 RepID=A0A0G0UQV7_9BACT|nr:MAG: hypothetical protein UU41_C0047G0009 [Candidatus Roizmanbacteria bacterium GW2011_GWA1_41_13]